jgi:hypothetical protein
MDGNTPRKAADMDQLVFLPTRTRIEPVGRNPLVLPGELDCRSWRPRVVRMPAGWWDSSSAVGCHLSPCPQAARAARRLTRDTFRDWGLLSLADDAEIIVGELVANAVTHAAPSAVGHGPDRGSLSLRLMRRTSEVVCAVLDPSHAAPVLKSPGGAEEAGRGLHMVDTVSDVWGWSPVAGRGKAVWAILFCS